MTKKAIQIPIDEISLTGDIFIPDNSQNGLIIFAHGSGSGRLSPRNQYVASVLQKEGFGTLLIDLLTQEEDQTYETRFNISLLTERLIHIVRYLRESKHSIQRPLGFFGASTGAAAALDAAKVLGKEISTIVSRGGRVDMAEKSLPFIQAPTLFIVGEKDYDVLRMNQIAFEKLVCIKELSIVPEATHLFEEPGALEEVAELAKKWFKKNLV